MSAPAPKKHGGARPNSGPKPKESGGSDETFRLYDSHKAKLQARMQRTGLNRSQALRQIIEESD
jgi:hypothetical protein